MRKRLVLFLILLLVLAGVIVYAALHKSASNGSASSSSHVVAVSNQDLISQIQLSDQYSVAFMPNPDPSINRTFMTVNGEISNNNSRALDIALLVNVQDKDSGQPLGSFISWVQEVPVGSLTPFSIAHPQLSSNQNVALSIRVVGAK